jgi:hypothetical protein
MIVKRPMGTGVDLPSSQLYLNSTSPMFVSIAEFINSYTGGTDVIPGYVDMSPDAMQYLFEYYLGGAGAFVRRVADFGSVGVPSALQGEFDDIEVGQVPFVRAWVGQAPSGAPDGTLPRSTRRDPDDRQGAGDSGQSLRHRAGQECPVRITRSNYKFTV